MNPPDTERLSWLCLTNVQGLGGAALRKLFSAFGLPAQVLAQPERALAQVIGTELARAVHQASQAGTDAFEPTLAWLAKPDCHLLTLADASYPALLLQTDDPPTLIFARGRLDLLSQPTLAMVGSRHATAQGLRDARAFAHALSDGGLTIVSGLALGIDTAAHEGALLGQAKTIAVLGTGIDQIYPARNASLFKKIASEGLLLTEYPLGAPPLTHHFPRRNRLISGLSRGCFVVEAALNSGSLITARYATEQGREVFALPGSIHSPLSRGCHALIKQGAKLVDRMEDVLSELGVWSALATTPTSSNTAKQNPIITPEDAALLAHLGYAPMDLDTLCLRTGHSAETLSAVLLQLELDGKVTMLPGGRVQRLS